MRIFLLTLFFSFNCLGELNVPLQKELQSMARADQTVRNEITRIGLENAPFELLEKMRSVDSKNTARLKAIVKKHSWVTEKSVGKVGVNAAFLIVQHSPDYAFQEEMLPMIKRSYLNDEGISGQELALLTDRVLVHQDKQQMYGTQLNIENGVLVFDPIYDIDNVDSRRAEVGLPSLEEYKKLISKAYGMPVK